MSALRGIRSRPALCLVFDTLDAGARAGSRNRIGGFCTRQVPLGFHRIVAILRDACGREEIEQAFKAFSRYQLAGLQALLSPGMERRM